MARKTFYSQSKNSVVVAAADGSWSRKITDYYEGDDAITWEPNAERVTITEGLDKSTISISSGTGGKITIKLKPSSPECGMLNKLYNLNATDPVLLNVSIVSGVEEIVKLDNCATNTTSTSSGGATMQARTFEFSGAKLKLDEAES